MARPFSSSTMSGDFDHPPADAGHDPPHPTLEGATTVLSQARSHRSALRHRLDEVRRLRDHMNDSDERRRLRMQQTAVREEIRRRHSSEQLHPPNAFPNETVPLPSSTLRSRMENIRNRARLRPQGHPVPTGTTASIQEAVEGLNAASSNLSTILDQPIPMIRSPEMNAREYSGEPDVNRRRKRRKLDSDVSTGHMNGFSYGYRGQVVSGPLKMEFVSCDGGIHNEAARHGKEYWPDNVLRNDKSVYCTNDSKCNIILRHLGETSFCLRKIVIKAPERGFTAPIQEGMIFVSMTSHDLLSRTAQYQMRDPSASRQSDDVDLLSPHDMADDNRPLSRRRDSSSNRTVPPAISNSVPRDIRHNGDTLSTAIENQTFPLEIGLNSTPNPRLSDPPENLGFNVSTTCDDPSSDEEEPSSPATLADLYRRDRLPPPYDSSADDDDDDGLERAMRRAGRIGAPSSHRRSRRKAEPSRIEVAWPSTDVAKATDLLAPHAKFFIESERSVVSIKFDPPVSGNFILLKLWSPAKDQNIDIQSIVCHGFAGPRFFPAVQMI